jgi:hypothetical protein
VEGTPWPSRKHEGIKRHSEEKNAQGSQVVYSEWYIGWIVTSAHIVVVDYDKEGRVIMWKWL